MAVDIYMPFDRTYPYDRVMLIPFSVPRIHEWFQVEWGILTELGAVDESVPV